MPTDAMTLVTVRLPREQLAAVEALVDAGEYPNTSEAIRAAIEAMLQERRDDEGPPGSYLPAHVLGEGS